MESGFVSLGKTIRQAIVGLIFMVFLMLFFGIWIGQVVREIDKNIRLYSYKDRDPFQLTYVGFLCALMYLLLNFPFVVYGGLKNGS